MSIFKKITFRINCYFLGGVILFSFVYSYVDVAVVKEISVAIMVIAAITATVPSFIGSMGESLLTVWCFVKNFFERLFMAIIRKEVSTDPKVTELTSAVRKIAREMGIKKEIRLRVIPNLKNAFAFGHSIYIGKPIVIGLDNEFVKSLSAHELGHIKSSVEKKKLEWRSFLPVNVLIVFVALLFLFRVCIACWAAIGFVIIPLFIQYSMCPMA
jgi:Zn-dependent protease with chaperone function